MPSLDFLEKVDVFQGLNDDQLATVKECCEVAPYRRGDVLFGIDEKPRFLWAVIEGEVALKEESPALKSFMRDDAVSIISRFKTFGWSSLVPPFRYRLSAHCSTRTCEVLKVDSTCLYALFEKDENLGYVVMSNVLSVVGGRFHRLLEEVIQRRGHEIMNRW